MPPVGADRWHDAAFGLLDCPCEAERGLAAVDVGRETVTMVVLLPACKVGMAVGALVDALIDALVGALVDELIDALVGALVDALIDALVGADGLVGVGGELAAASWYKACSAYALSSGMPY
jgi:hypothetical protein